ncbi:Conserved_hypothetical protein [Hexamita inflata]|uniref:Uncharacterized protein n=1 Tax=Hexamita inflata TaxID=28002 RepID=A0AA86TUS6_9EUKA|nr:Conserved hypothetical protein [Hexamita inflata]
MSGEYLTILTNTQQDPKRVKEIQENELPLEYAKRYCMQHNLSPKLHNQVKKQYKQIQQVQDVSTLKVDSFHAVQFKFRDTDMLRQTNNWQQQTNMEIQLAEQRHQAYKKSDCNDLQRQNFSKNKIIVEQEREIFEIEQKQIQEKAQIIDITADNAFEYDYILSRKIQQQVQEQYDNSGPVWGIGGISMEEVQERFVKIRNDKLIEDPMSENTTKYPFNPLRDEYFALTKQIIKRKIDILSSLLVKYKLQTFYEQFNEVWPLILQELSFQFDLKLQDCRNSFKQLLYEQVAPITDQRRNVMIHICNELKRLLEEEFSVDIDKIIKQLFAQNLFDKNKHLAEKVMSYIKDVTYYLPNSHNPDNKFISANIQQRVGDSTSINDNIRYIEAFSQIVNINQLFSNVNLDKSIITATYNYLQQPQVARLSFYINQMFEVVFLEPLMQTLNHFKTEKGSNIAKSTTALEVLQTAGEALTPAKQSAIRHKDFWDFCQLLNDNQQQVNALQGQFFINKIQNEWESMIESEQQVDIINSGQKMFVNALKTELKQQQRAISPMRFRKFKYEYMDKKAKEQEDPSDQLIKIHKLQISPRKTHHFGFVLPVALIAAKMAAIKVAEEKYAFLLFSHVGRVQEQKFLALISEIIRSGGVVSKTVEK